MNSTKCWVSDRVYVEDDVKVWDNCNITGNYRGFAHRDCNVKAKLNQKVPIVL